MDAAVREVARGFIVEALSWAETTDGGRLGYERAEAILAAHDAEVRREGAAKALTEVADAWQWGAWTVLTSKAKRSTPMAAAQVVTDWLRARATREAGR